MHLHDAENYWQCVFQSWVPSCNVDSVSTYEGTTLNAKIASPYEIILTDEISNMENVITIYNIHLIAALDSGYNHDNGADSKYDMLDHMVAKY